MKENGRYAVIDLGTNTFHILVVEYSSDGVINQLHKERIYVKLAEDGIGKIGEGAFLRGLNAMDSFSKIISEYKINEIRAFGTAALRTASNGSVFVKTVKGRTGINIETISGKEEARLIHKGVLQAIPRQEETIVIMDIGGGSVEFVIADNDQVYWSESFPIGVAVLFKQFHQNDPITDNELTLIHSFLEKELTPFLNAMDKYKVQVLVGASGTFDVLEIMMHKKSELPKSTKLTFNTFSPLYEKLINTSYKERISMEEIPNTRADMIIVAMELIKFVLDKTKINDIIVSSYAMKEGILNEMIEKTRK